jgi:hypothetical protein
VTDLQIPPSNSRFIRLKFRGVCVSCDSELSPGDGGWHDAETKLIVCAQCGPESNQDATQQLQRPVAPVGGYSALRRSHGNGDRNWRKGAIGEFRLDAYLHRELTSGEIILSDRSIPGGRGNVDHVVIAPSGIWVIDAKLWSGTINLTRSGRGLNESRHLLVKEEDRTSVVEKIYDCVIPIAQLVDDRTIRVHPAVVFVDGQWSNRLFLRVVLNRPEVLNGVWIMWPKALLSKIKEPGPLSSEQVSAIGHHLDAALAPMGE